MMKDVFWKSLTVVHISNMFYFFFNYILLHTYSNILQSPLEIKPTSLWIIISILLHTEA
jgi:hypothetical protein